MTYEQFSTKVGEHLDVEPTHIRFAPVVASTGRPKPFIKRTITQNLQQILAGQYATYGYNMHRSDALFYEVLETSLSEYETKKNLKITWLPEGITKEVSLSPVRRLGLMLMYFVATFRGTRCQTWDHFGFGGWIAEASQPRR